MAGSYLSARIQVEPAGDGARYHLAPRALGALRQVGWILLAAAALVLWGAGAVLRQLLAPLREQSWREAVARPESLPVEAWVGLAIGLVGGLFALAAAFGLARYGSFLLAGRSEVRLGGGRLSGIERGGPFTLRRRVRAGDVVVLRIGDQLAGGGAAAGAGLLVGTAKLEAVTARGRTVTLANGYPADELEALARDLAGRIPSAPMLAGGTLRARPAVERADRAAPAAAERPPAGSTLVVRRTGGALSVQAPAAGLVRGSYGLFAFAIVWSGVVAVMTVILVAAVAGGARPDTGSLIGAAALLALFGTVGGLFFYFGVRAGTRSTTLELAGGELRVATVALGRTREERLDARELAAVTVAPSGIRINGRDILELRLVRADGRALKLLRERTPAELDWLAAVLRDELHLPIPREESV